jgi:hypothetical protein
MANSKAKLKSSGDEIPPCVRPFWIEKLSDRCLTEQALLYVSFKYVVISLTSYIVFPNSMTILYITSLITESTSFLKVMNS